ncbi:hypothetical protein QFZ67_000202 [Streptomyces sp. V1I1]|nr:hypothetical protein [Streptomyces sp. V1I1]
MPAERRPGSPGGALIAHVAVYHLGIAVMLAVTIALLDLPIGWTGAATGIASIAEVTSLLAPSGSRR